MTTLWSEQQRGIIALPTGDEGISVSQATTRITTHFLAFRYLGCRRERGGSISHCLGAFDTEQQGINESQVQCSLFEKITIELDVGMYE